MEYNNIKVNNYNVHFIKTKNFRDNYISIRFTNEMTKDRIKYFKFLKELLVKSTKKYNKKDLTIQKENLYNLLIKSNINVVGNNCIFDINFKFLNSKYSKKDIDKKVFELINEVVFNPNVINNQFLDFDEVKSQIIEDEIKQFENKEYLSLKECIKKTDINNPMNFLYSDDIINTTNKDIFDAYKELIDSSVDIFIIGNIDIELYKGYLKNFDFKNDKTYKDFVYKYNNNLNENNIIEVKNDIFKQASLFLSYKLNELSDFERFYVVKLFSIIIGGSPDSKLFKNVREKYSLAYYCNSNVYTYNSLFLIRSGIDYINKNKCVKLIKKELNNKITNKELGISKKIVFSKIENTFNSFSSIIEYYYELKYFNFLLEDTYKNFNKVTIQDIENIRKKLVYSTMAVVYGN